MSAVVMGEMTLEGSCCLRFFASRISIGVNAAWALPPPAVDALPLLPVPLTLPDAVPAVPEFIPTVDSTALRPAPLALPGVGL